LGHDLKHGSKLLLREYQQGLSHMGESRRHARKVDAPSFREKLKTRKNDANKDVARRALDA
jgi:hypothetical protein